MMLWWLGVGLLLSEPLHDMLTDKGKKMTRQVDRIKRSSDENPLLLFTFDYNLKWIRSTAQGAIHPSTSYHEVSYPPIHKYTHSPTAHKLKRPRTY